MVKSDKASGPVISTERTAILGRASSLHCERALVAESRPIVKFPSAADDQLVEAEVAPNGRALCPRPVNMSLFRRSFRKTVLHIQFAPFLVAGMKMHLATRLHVFSAAAGHREHRIFVICKRSFVCDLAIGKA